MAYIANTMFEVKVSNSVRNQTQNVAGKYGTNTGVSFSPADCSAGQLCVRNGLIPLEGYESIPKSGGGTYALLNGNTYYFNKATSGLVAGMTGDHTGIYAFNNYDVQKAVNGDNAWNVGFKTLGLGLPAGERGDFTELIVGEIYRFGSGNFSASVSTNGFATISSDGLLTPAANAPAGGTGVYFQILRSVPVNEGTDFWGTAYDVRVLRTAEVAEG